MADYLLGIDGGGSKTDILLCDTELNEIARQITDRSNPNDVGIEKTVSVLREGITRLLDENGISAESISACFAGIAGITCADYAIPVENTLKNLLPNATVGVSHDGINVLYGAFPFSDGVSVICGTGSSCFVKKGGAIHRTGGYGAFDRCGNGYEIGFQAVAHALKAIDGREKRGVLDDLLEQKLGSDALTALDKLLLMSKNELASLAPIVFDAAESGDKTAMMIIFENMSYIAELIEISSRYFEDTFEVALAGGIFRSEYAVELLEGLLDPRVTLIRSDRAPSFGAAAKAKQL